MDDELSKQRQLLAMLRGDDDDKEIDKQQLRYGLYVRKSTAGDEKQRTTKTVIAKERSDCGDPSHEFEVC